MKKTLLATTIATLLLTACGGGSDTPTPAGNGGDGGNVITPPPAAVPVETVVSGEAIKGTLTNAIVTVYKYVDGQAVALTEDELVDANITTSADGSYTFTLLDYSGPVKVELSPSTDAANPTTMICDAPAGCGDIAFGETIDITAVDPAFTLSAISLADSENEVTVNVSSLTHLASALIEADDDGINTATVQDNSSLIANTFGIQGSITELEPTAVNDASAVATEDNDNELRYGLINAGIAAAIFSDESSTTDVLSNKFNDIITDLVENEGALLINQDEDDAFELSITDVLDGAIATSDTVVALINADDTLTDTTEALAELAQLETNLENKKIAETVLSGEDGRSQVGTEIITNGDAIAKASAMVEDVRLFSHLFDVNQTSHDEIGTEGEAYLALIDDAGAMVEAEADSFLLLAEISDAIAELSMQYENETLSGTVFPINAYLSADNASGSITFDEDNLVFAVDATSGGETVNLNIAIVFADDGLSVNLNLDGLIESAGASLTLADGSFAKINLDSSISKESLEDDSFDGDIISGELKLDVSLAQKLSDAVVNPVTFTGSINTKLLPIEATQVSGTYPDYYWEENYNGNYETIYKPSNEVVILPEMLSLSGGFSSLEGNLIKATLTVNITNLDGYQAPEPQSIGETLEALKTFTVSDDLNTVTINDAETVLYPEEKVLTYTAGSQAGEWSATQEITFSEAKEDQVNKYLSVWVSRIIDYGLDKPGYQYSASFTVYNESHDNGYIVNDVSIYTFTPIDHNGDLIVDAYQVSSNSISAWNNPDGYSFDPESPFNADGDMLTTTGEILTFDNTGAWDQGEFSTFEDYVAYYPWGINEDPAATNNAGDLYIATMTAAPFNYLNSDISTSKGTVKISYDDDSLEPLREGNNVALDGYITKALIEDAGTITSSDDGNTITTVIDDILTSTVTFSGENGNWQANHNVVTNNGETRSLMMSSATEDVGQLTPAITLSISDYDQSYQIKLIPLGLNEWGDQQFDQRIVFGDNFNNDGMLVDEDGAILTAENNGWIYESYREENDVSWLSGNNFHTGFNPLNIERAQDIFSTIFSGFYVINNNWLISQNIILGSQDGIGEISLIAPFGSENFEKIVSLSAGTIINIDSYNTAPESTSTQLENEEFFLQGNAALSLEVALGDYEVDLQLSGEKTGLADGNFDLSLAYKLPDDSAQRSFTVHANTEQTDTLTITNLDDVTVTLTELSEDDEQSGEVVLGIIMVGSGDDSEQAAQIVDRDGLILVVYADGSVESL